VPNEGEVRYATTGDGVHIAYRVAGSGPDIVFIPPWLSTVELDVDDPFVGPTLRRLSSIGRCVSFDKRGSGMSDDLEGGAAVTTEQRVAELVAVLDAVGMRRATILTGADGAAIATTFAVAHPERVVGLCLYAPFARALWSEDYPIGFPPEVVELMAEATATTWGDGTSAPTAPSKASDPAFLEWFGRYQRRSASPSAARRFLGMALRTDVRDVLPSVEVPVVVVHRRDDQLVPLELGRYVAEHIPNARMVVLDGIDHFWAVGDTEPLLDVVEEIATGATSGGRRDRVLSTVMFTDIVGSTARAAALGDRRWKDLLESHDRLLHDELRRFGGRAVGSAGDGLLATFDLPSSAVRCACAIQQAVRVLDLQVRVGIHTGELELRGEDVAGMAVHVGARIGALAEGDEVLASPAIPPLVAGSGISFRERGEHELKGVPGTWRLYAVDRASV